jgi:hypothetical protein
MIRRILMLEKTSLISNDDEAEDGPAASVRVRRTLRLQTDGGNVSCKRSPSMPFPCGATIADVIRVGRYGTRPGCIEVAL